VDWWAQYESDARLARDAGSNAFRFSISWNQHRHRTDGQATFTTRIRFGFMNTSRELRQNPWTASPSLPSASSTSSATAIGGTLLFPLLGGYLRIAQVALLAIVTAAPLRARYLLLVPILYILPFGAQFIPYIDNRVTWRGYRHGWAGIRGWSISLRLRRR
jgi:hypothetical protein